MRGPPNRPGHGPKAGAAADRLEQMSSCGGRPRALVGSTDGPRGGADRRGP